jgi:hypothetical protein
MVYHSSMVKRKKSKKEEKEKLEVRIMKGKVQAQKIMESISKMT